MSASSPVDAGKASPSAVSDHVVEDSNEETQAVEDVNEEIHQVADEEVVPDEPVEQSEGVKEDRVATQVGLVDSFYWVDIL